MAQSETVGPLKKSDYAGFIQKGIGYKEYKQRMADDFLQNSDSQIKEYIRINQRRMERVEKTYKIPEEMMVQIKHLKPLGLIHKQ